MNSIHDICFKNSEIMIVDDIIQNVKLLMEVLSREGFQVRTANRGELALRSIRAKKPELVLLDIMMDGMDGYEVCRQLKADSKTAQIPIIFISAFGEETQKVKGFEAGGVDYVTKPFSPEEVLSRVKTHIALRRAQEELETRATELEKALTQVKKLSGLLPICCSCKKIRDDSGYWQQIEDYISNHAEVDFSHGICPNCLRDLYPEYADNVLSRLEQEQKIRKAQTNSQV